MQNKYQIDLSVAGQWVCSLRFHGDDSSAHDKLMELAQERPGRQFQLVNLTTNKWMGYACVQQRARENSRQDAG